MGSKPGRGCNVLSAMISFKTNPLLLVFAVLSVYSCTKDPVAPVTTPGLELLDFTELKRTSVILKANPSSATHITECGFLVGKSYDLNDARKYPIADYADGEMSLELTGLEIGATYYYQAYLADGEQTLTTATNSFTTATQSAPLISDFKLTGSTLSATISDNGGRSITHAGFCWGTQEHPDIFGHSAEVTVSGNSFSMTLPDVAINTTYYFRAFADNGADGNNAIAYSAEQVTYRKDEESQLVLSSSEIVTSQDSGTFEIVVQANIDFTVQNPDVDWIHPVGTKAAESHTLTYLVDKNETYEDRYAEIKIIAASIGKTETVSVKQVQKDAIVVAKDSYTVDASGGTVQFTVNHNVEYDTSIRVDWIKLVDTKAMTSDELSFSVEPNSSLDNREGQIVFTSKDGAITQHVAIYQAQTNSIVVSETEKVIGPDGGSFDIVVNANIEYSVTDPDVDWIRLIETKSTTSKTFVYSVSAYDGYGYRTGHIVISAQSGENVVTITQTGSNTIAFADARVKSILVAEYDANRDGEISYEEAASVTSFLKQPVGFRESVFKDSDIQSFDEFQYFTGITDTERAFSGCSNLSAVTLPGSVTNVGDETFANCSSLNSVIIPRGVSHIGNSAFYGCRAMQEVQIPETVTSIGNAAFYGCQAMREIQLPESVSSIGNSAFYLCSSLVSVAIPLGVASINRDTFCQCENLVSVAIPESVTKIDSLAFNFCTNLASIAIPNSVTSIGSGAFASCSSLSSVIIPESVTRIARATFQYCSGLSSITIPESVTSIGKQAFQYCSGLTSITIPERVTSIEAELFSDCSSLVSVIIPEGVISIGDGAFVNCTALPSCVIPANVTSIGSNAFRGCSSITSIVIPDGVASIEDHTFEGCSSLTSISIPESIKSIGYWSFYGCTSLVSISLPENVNSISEGAFQGCSSLAKLSLPEGLTYLGASAFNGCSSLSSISIPNGVPSIGTSTFMDCSNLTTVIIPNSVTSIGVYAFYGCSNLTNAAIPEGVISIGGQAFLFCRSLTEMILPNSVTSIGNSTFQGCSNLTTVVLPAELNVIGELAFSGDFNLTAVAIPQTVNMIGKGAFSYCSGLTTITVPEKVTSIGEDAFWLCTNLSSIIVEPTTPPSLGNSSVFHSVNCPFYVPAASLDSYRTTAGWSEYADRIQAMP